MAHANVCAIVAAFFAMVRLSHAALTLSQGRNRRPESPLVGLALAPSKSDIKLLALKVQEAVDYESALIMNITNSLIGSCKGEDNYKKEEAKQLALTSSPVIRARKMTEKAKADLTKAQYYYDLETKRDASLPQLVRQVQNEANKEHQKRVEAEKWAEEAKMAADLAQQKAYTKLEPFRQAVARKRFEDRLRASQDVVIAKQAMEAAAKARKQLAAKKVADDMVYTAKRTYDEMRQRVSLAARTSMRQKQAELNQEMAKKTRAVAKETEKLKLAEKKAKKLRLKSVQSAERAQHARKVAIESKEQYQMVKNGLDALSKQIKQDETHEKYHLKIASDMKDQIAKEVSQLQSAQQDMAAWMLKDRADAQQMASKMQAATTKIGKKMGAAEVGVKISEADPLEYLSGASKGYKDMSKSS